MPALPLQLRLEPHHVDAIDAVRLLTDAHSGLMVTFSRQQVIVGILDQWIAGRLAHAPAVEELTPETPPAPAPRPQANARPKARAPRVPDALVARVQTMRQTLSFAQIAQALNAEGVPTMSGQGQWGKGSVQRLLAKA